jgi:hypothetical protein
MNYYSETKEFVIGRQDFYAAYDLSGGGTVELQQKINGAYVTQVTATQDSPTEWRGFNAEIRLLVTGAAGYETNYRPIA